MTKFTYKEYLSIAILLVVIGVVSLLQQRPWAVLGESAVGEATRATSTPQLADQTNLCPQNNFNMASSTTGTLDFVAVTSPISADLLILDGTTTNSTLRIQPSATTSNILLWLPAGTGTTTVKMGVEFKKGLLVDYSGTGTTTIGYRCGS